MRKLRPYTILLFFVSFLVSAMGCRPPADHFALPYDLTAPDRELKLDRDLDEISAIASIGNKQLAALEDEKGIIYLLSTTSGKIEDEFEFGEAADYEGLAYHEGVFHALSSDGRLYTVDRGKESQQSSRSIRLAVENKAELEGICHDPKKDRYLMAYKTAEGISSADQRNIYTYKTSRSYHARLPYLAITTKKITNYLETAEHQQKQLSELLGSSDGKTAVFLPSDLAIHPLTGHVYLVSAVNELLMVMDPDAGQIVYLHQFDKDDLNQPEGITFDNDGDMYISSEKGSAKNAVILRFETEEL